MKRITYTRSGWVVERVSRYGMALGAILLGVAWFIVCVPLMPSGRWWGLIFLATLIFGIPAAILAAKSGRQRRRIIAVIDAREVAGGVLLRVVDERQVQHELVTDNHTAERLAHGFTGQASVER